DESALVENASWLLTKHRIIGKVFGVFGALSESYNSLLEDYSAFIPKEVTAVSPKIFKGEHYRQLPYVMLDQPRYFKHDDTFAIRTFFWWGNSFSIHLLLGGRYKQMFERKIQSHLNDGSLGSWYIGVSADPWQHHFEEENYLPVSELRNNNVAIHESNYLKIGKWHDVIDWKGAFAFFITSYKQILESLV
ncbi:MAG TPA: hypothetical protein VM101_03730, partial [Flavitalea sp.]|nr:hypothetical protein [Flavitalea sp.]